MKTLGLLTNFRAKSKAEEKAIAPDEQFYFNLDLSKTVVTSNNIMEVPVVKGVVDLLTNIISKVDYTLCDIKTNKEIEDGRVKLLNYNTNTSMSVNDFRRAVISDALIYGDSHIYIKKKGLKVEALIYVPRNQISIIDNSINNPIEQYKDIKIQVGGTSYDSFEFVNVCFGKTTNGVNGKSLADSLGQAIGSNKAINDYVNRESSNGFLRKGMVKSANKIDREKAELIKAGYNNLFSNNGESLMILSNGLSYEDISSNPKDLMLDQLLKISDEQIASALGVPVDVLSGTCSEEQYRIFLQTKIHPMVETIVSALNQNLLLFEEQGVVEFRANLNSLYKADIVNQVKALSEMIQSGIISKNEARKELGRLEVEGLDGFSFGLGEVVYNAETKNYLNFNLGENMTSDGQIINNEEDIV